MSHSNLTFDVAEQVLQIGLRGAYVIIEGMTNRKDDMQFDSLMRQWCQLIKEETSIESIKSDPILNGFRMLHDAVGRSNRRHVASPENLLLMLDKTGNLPRINLIVDIYNLISIRTRLALGAHDMDKLSGNIHLRVTDGSETFWPLGSSKAQGVGVGEYCYVDDDNDVICRLEVRQVEKTKVTLDTTAAFYIVQGNAATSDEHLADAARELIRLTTQYCGGSARVLHPPHLLL